MSGPDRRYLIICLERPWTQHHGQRELGTKVGSDKFAAGIFDRVAFRGCIMIDIYHSGTCNSTMQPDRDFRGDADQTFHFPRPFIVQYPFVPLNVVTYFHKRWHIHSCNANQLVVPRTIDVTYGIIWRYCSGL